MLTVCQVELETKSMFIRYISHEIRNPLNSVQLGLESLEKELVKCRDNVARLDILRDVKTSLQASITTLNDMLTSDKIRSGLLVLERKNVDVMNLVSTVAQRHQTQVLRYSYRNYRKLLINSSPYRLVTAGSHFRWTVLVQCNLSSHAWMK